MHLILLNIFLILLNLKLTEPVTQLFVFPWKQEGIQDLAAVLTNLDRKPLNSAEQHHGLHGPDALPPPPPPLLFLYPQHFHLHVLLWLYVENMTAGHNTTFWTNVPKRLELMVLCPDVKWYKLKYLSENLHSSTIC